MEHPWIMKYLSDLKRKGLITEKKLERLRVTKSGYLHTVYSIQNILDIYVERSVVEFHSFPKDISFSDFVSFAKQNKIENYFLANRDSTSYISFKNAIPLGEKAENLHSVLGQLNIFLKEDGSNSSLRYFHYANELTHFQIYFDDNEIWIDLENRGEKFPIDNLIKLREWVDTQLESEKIMEEKLHDILPLFEKFDPNYKIIFPANGIDFLLTTSRGNFNFYFYKTYNYYHFNLSDWNIRLQSSSLDKLIEEIKERLTKEIKTRRLRALFNP